MAVTDERKALGRANDAWRRLLGDVRSAGSRLPRTQDVQQPDSADSNADDQDDDAGDVLTQLPPAA